jgi:hypothetical protein
MPLGRSVVGLSLVFACVLTTTANSLTKHTQKGTFLQTSTGVFVTSSNGTVVQKLFPVAKIVCPAVATQSCTFYVHVETASTASISVGQFRFLVDGAAPTPGPTDASGFVTFSAGVSDETEAFSHAVVGKVTNSVDNQSHTVEVDLACTSGGIITCQVGAGSATLRIDIFQP